METINFIDPLFNYQIIFICSSTKKRIIFTGETSNNITDLFNELLNCIDLSIRFDYKVESVVYQPINNNDYGTKKTD